MPLFGNVHPCTFPNSTFENRRYRYEARAQINRRHGKKYTSLYIFYRACVFAGQTRYWLKPPPSVVEMTRWGFFSSGTDAAGSIRSDVSAMLKLAVKSVQGCTLLTRQRSRYAVYFQKKRTAWSTASNRPYFGCIRNGLWMLLPPFSVPFWSYYRRLL